MSEDETTAIVPIDEVLPELRAEQYARVRAWDDARMALASGYEAADGEYLRKIRDVLKDAGHGLWTRYLEARGIPARTAQERIQKAEGRYQLPKRADSARLHNPDPLPALPEPTPTYEPVARWPTMPVGGSDLPAWSTEPPRVANYAPLPTWEPVASPEPGPEPADEYDEDAPLVVAPYTPRIVPTPPAQPPLTMESAAKLIAEGRAMSPHAAGMPFSAALVTLSQTVWTVKDAAIEGWLDTSEANMWESAEYTLNGIIEWARHAQELLAARKRAGLRVVR